MMPAVRKELAAVMIGPGPGPAHLMLSSRNSSRGSKLLSKARDLIELVVPCKKQIHQRSSADFSSWLTVPKSSTRGRVLKQWRLVLGSMDPGNETEEDVSVKARGGSAANNCRRGLGKVRVTGPRLCLDNRGDLRRPLIAFLGWTSKEGFLFSEKIE
ncbi:hypothetical protein NC651_000637 [Populus alba x Populus x berolinensis]|nr:hypothetical protein NC651_000637 [Populus alba x Populus x berolinensis]